MHPTDSPAPTIDALLAHRAWVRRLARSLVADVHAADDIEQQTWLAAMTAPPRDATSPRGWLGAVARNVARKLVRGERRRSARDLASGAPRDERTPEQLLAEAEIHHRVSAALLALAEPYRTTLLHRFVDDLPPRAVAARMGVSVETVRTRVRRGIDLMRERLDAVHHGRRESWALVLAPPSAEASAAPLSDRETPGSAATRPTPATAGSDAVALGGLLVTTTTKCAAAAAILAGLTWLTWRTAAPDAEHEIGGADTPIADARTPSVATRAARAARDAAPDSAAAATDARRDPTFEGVDPDRDAHGVVVTRDGAPVADAEVVATHRPWESLQPPDISLWRTTLEGPRTRTAADGTFSLRLTPGDVRSLRVRAAGHASADVPNVPAGGRVRVVLDPAVQLTVTVRGPGDTPVAGALIRVRDPQTRVFGKPGFEEAAVTGADGTATFASLPARTVALVECRPVAHVTPAWTQIELGEPGPQRAEIRLLAGRSLLGRVVDASTGGPVAGARVGEGWTLDRAVATDADGRFALPGCHDVPATSVRVVALGYADHRAAIDASSEAAIALVPEVLVRGRVVADEDGLPVAGALVVVKAHVPDATVRATVGGAATSASDGTFEVHGVAPGLAHEVSVRAPGFASHGGAVAADLPAGGTCELGDVRLARGRFLDGVVLDAQGAPLADVNVVLTVRADGPNGAPTASATRRTDDRGRFRVADLAGGTWTATATTSDGGRAEASVAAPPPAGSALVTLTLRRDGPVVVRVTDAGGSALAGVTVSLHTADASTPRGRGTTDARGTATLVPGPGRYRLSVRPDAESGLVATSQTINVDAAGATFDVRLERRCVVAGVVLGPDGRAIGGAQVRVARDATRLGELFTDADGRFRIEVPGDAAVDVRFTGTVLGARRADGSYPADDCDLRAAAAGVRPDAAEVVLRAAAVTRRRLVVRVTLPSGEPAAGVSVQVRGRDLAPWPTARTDASGEAVFADLPRLKVAVHVQGNGVVCGAAPVDVGPDDERADAALRPAATLTGVAVDEDGRGVPADIHVFLGDEEVEGHEAGSDGAFRLRVPHVPGARFRLVATTWNAGDESAGELADVAPGADGLRVVLRRSPRSAR